MSDRLAGGDHLIEAVELVVGPVPTGPGQPLGNSPRSGVAELVKDPHRLPQPHVVVLEELGGPCVRVGIFLSVFNVHVNRSPCDGRVTKVIYKEGKFINAMNPTHASSDNESNTVVLAEPAGDRPVAVVKQIVGLIARRIICTVKDGDQVARGERIGMI